MKACFMFGHADCPDDSLPKIMEAIEKFYKEFDMRVFYVGNRGNFDSLAATAAKKVKEKYPDLSLELVLAYHPGERLVSLRPGFDGSYYPPLEGVPRRAAIVQANRYMVETADAILCYVQHFGNTRDLLEYARKKRQIPIENVASA